MEEMKMNRTKQIGLIFGVIVILSLVYPVLGLGAKRIGTPSRTHFTTSEVRTDFKMGRMFDMGDVFYMHYATSYWDVVSSDDPRFEGENVVKICGFFTKEDPPMPIEMWGTFRVRKDGRTTWRGTWHSGFDPEGNPVVVGSGYGVKQYRGLRFTASYYMGPNNELGQMTETSSGYIIDLYSSG